jgi:hypothetical protein
MSAKPLKCNRGCGTTIHFDDYHVSKTGKKIPLEEDGEPHQCPNSDYQKEQGQRRGGIDGSGYYDLNALGQKIDKILDVVIEINNKLIRIESGQSTLEGPE